MFEGHAADNVEGARALVVSSAVDEQNPELQEARRLGLQGPDAADLVQDVFTLLAAKLPHFRPGPRQRFRDWLWTVTVARARQRHHRAAQEHSLTARQVACHRPAPLWEMTCVVEV